MKKRFENGYTLIEMMVVVIIIAIIAAVAYPNYQNYVVKTKRAEMMAELQNIGSLIESRKLASGRGGYRNVDVSDLGGDFPRGGNTNYVVAVNTDDNGWSITAEPAPKSTQLKDGTLTLERNGRKCRGDSLCGVGDEWKQ